MVVDDGADAADLKDAVCAKLCLRLLREVEGGGSSAPLDSRRALAEQGVLLEGSSIEVEILPLPLSSFDSDLLWQGPILLWQGPMRSTARVS